MDNGPFPDRLLNRTSAHVEAGVCLDAETLAAWTDGTLTAQQRAAAEAHAADCDRCLATLAAMARTEPPPQLAARPTWRGTGWLVPLAAASVALTTWIVLRDLPEPVTPIPESANPARVAESAPVEQQAEARADAAAKAPSPLATPAIVVQERAERRADNPVSTRALDRVQSLEQKRAAAGNETPRRDESTSTRVGETAGVAPAAPPPAAPASALRAFAQVVVPSPDPSVQWRLSGSLVERSVDGGKTWVAQTTGVSGILVAGSSPAPTICWLVGPGGTVVVTVDGERWRLVPFSDRLADLRAVTASDGHNAAVTTLDKRTYITADGGVTWRLQEKSLAPF